MSKEHETNSVREVFLHKELAIKGCYLTGSFDENGREKYIIQVPGEVPLEVSPC